MRIVLLINLLILSFFGDLLSQEIIREEESPIKKKDTVCFKMIFNKTDTLIYNVVSNDSIIIDYGTPLIKKRNEKLMIICDSVTKKGRIFLSCQLIDFKSTERRGDSAEVEHNFTPWLNRKIRLEIDSLGNRHSFRYDDTIHAAMAPGGAFQPNLLFPFQQSCKAIKESWMVESLDELPENSFPPSLLKQSSLFRAKEPIDTLGYHCNRFEFIKTAQGSIQVPTEDGSMKITNIIAGFGNMLLSADKWIPIHYFSTVEQKLTLHFGNEITKPGLHYISSYFTLEAYKPGKK